MRRANTKKDLLSRVRTMFKCSVSNGDFDDVGWARELLDSHGASPKS